MNKNLPTPTTCRTDYLLSDDDEMVLVKAWSLRFYVCISKTTSNAAQIEAAMEDEG